MQPVTATGTKGFLQWLKQYSPGVYAQIAGELPRKAPQLFSDFEAGGGVAGAQQRALSGLGDASTDTSLQPLDFSAADSSVSIPTVDVADAANSTATDSSSASWLSSLIQGVSSAYLTVNQAQQNNQIVQAQLARAAAGQPPLTITAGAVGLPTIAAGLSSSSGLLIVGGLALLGVLFMASRGRK